jgi:hypothetical protein
MRRPLAQEQQQRRLGEPLDAREDAPTAAMVSACARSSQFLATCKRHM